VDKRKRTESLSPGLGEFFSIRWHPLPSSAFRETAQHYNPNTTMKRICIALSWMALAVCLSDPGMIFGGTNSQPLTIAEIKTNLLNNPPGLGDPVIREDSLRALDSILLRYSSPGSVPFYREQVARVAEEIEADAPRGACVIWMMYNHGFIVKMPETVIAFDLISGSGVTLPDAIVKRIDVLFISHEHGDHYDAGVVSRVLSNKRFVVAPSEMFATGLGRFGMRAGDSRTITNLQVTAHYGLHSVPVRMFEVTCPNGLKILHTGDNQTSWNLPRVGGCVLFLNSWVNDSGSVPAAVGMRNSLQMVQPRLMFPGHIQELGHAYTPGDPTSRVIYAWAFGVDDQPTAAPFEVMAWGERYTLVLNHPPIAQSQSVVVDEDSSVVVSLAASDPEGAPLTYTVTSPAHGELSCSPPALVYRPYPNYFGPDSFTFKVNDGQFDSEPGTVSITVAPVNDPPVAAFSVSALAEFPGMTNQAIISPDGVAAQVLLDATATCDVENDPLQFEWSEAGTAIASGMIATVVLPVGSRTILLAVTDGQDTGTQSATFEIITPAHAVGILEMLVRDSELSHRRQRPLLASLRAAEAAFWRGNYVPALNEVHAFKNKVQAQVRALDPSLADRLLEAADLILETVLPGRTPTLDPSQGR
jgi:hypothetical protein